MDQVPSVGRIVHYVSYGTPGGEYTIQCRAAIIAHVYPPEGGGLLSGGELQDEEPQTCSLVVLNPNGVFFGDCPQDESDKAGGTWHWPERV